MTIWPFSDNFQSLFAYSEKLFCSAIGSYTIKLTSLEDKYWKIT